MIIVPVELTVLRFLHTGNERLKLVEEWASIEPEGQHAAARYLRHPRTGEWFLKGEAFQAFIEDSSPPLWLYGLRMSLYALYSVLL